MIKLEIVRANNYLFQSIRNKHYVENNGTIGRQIHYLIFDTESFGIDPIGIISGASPVYACKARDTYFGITFKNRIKKLDYIINNTVFRLEKNEKNLASKILAIWRKKIIVDWYKKYGILINGFETFVYGKNRTGAIYKADNWSLVGITKGYAKKSNNVYVNSSSRQRTETKLVFCK